MEKLLLQRNPVCGFAFLGVDEVGVDLGGFDTLVGEHLRDCVDVRAECDLKRGKGMAGAMKGQSFLDTANRSDLFEVVVTLLIGGYREQSIVATTTLIFRQNLQRDIQEGYIYRCRSLLAVCAKPRAVIRSCDDMFACECSRIAVGKAREATEHEDIAYLLQALRWHRLLHYSCQLVHCEVSTLGLLVMELKVRKWILLRPAVVDSNLINGLEFQNGLHHIVCREVELRAQEYLEAVNKLRIDLVHRDVRTLVLRLHILGYTLADKQVAVVCNFRCGVPDKLRIVLNVIIKEFKQRHRFFVF